jgi:hypothetical protein
MRPTEHRVPMTGMLFIHPVRRYRVLTTAGPIARSVGDLRLALEVIGGPDGHDPEVPPVSWRPAEPPDLNGLRVAYSPGYPPLVAAEIRAGRLAAWPPGRLAAWPPGRLAAELDELGAVVEYRLPDPALAGYGQLVEDFFSVLDSGSAQEYLATWTAGTGSSPAGTGSSRAVTCSLLRSCRCAPGARTTSPPTTARRCRPFSPSSCLRSAVARW